MIRAQIARRMNHCEEMGNYPDDELIPLGTIVEIVGPGEVADSHCIGCGEPMKNRRWLPVKLPNGRTSKIDVEVLEIDEGIHT